MSNHICEGIGKRIKVLVHFDNEWICFLLGIWCLHGCELGKSIPTCSDVLLAFGWQTTLDDDVITIGEGLVVSKNILRIGFLEVKTSSKTVNHSHLIFVVTLIGCKWSLWQWHIFWELVLDITTSVVNWHISHVELD